MIWLARRQVPRKLSEVDSYPMVVADRVLDAMAEALAAVTFAAHVSPLASRIDAIRARILAEAKTHRWPIAESQLDDRHIVRRMVLAPPVLSLGDRPSECLVEPTVGSAGWRLRRGDREFALCAPGASR